MSKHPDMLDYSNGYPRHVRHQTFERDQTLVQLGYQDSVRMEEKVYQLGYMDAHKKPYYHPSNKCVPQKTRGTCNKTTPCCIVDGNCHNGLKKNRH